MTASICGCVSPCNGHLCFHAALTLSLSLAFRVRATGTGPTGHGFAQLLRPRASTAPAAPPGKPRRWVSEGVGCLKVQRERGPGFPRPPEGEIFETDMHPQMEAVTQTCIHKWRQSCMHKSMQASYPILMMMMFVYWYLFSNHYTRECSSIRNSNPPSSTLFSGQDSLYLSQACSPQNSRVCYLRHNRSGTRCTRQRPSAGGRTWTSECVYSSQDSCRSECT